MGKSKLTVIYFTYIPLDVANNGGSIACRNHIARMRADAKIDLKVVALRAVENFSAAKNYLDSIGIEGVVVPHFQNRVHSTGKTLRATAKFAWAAATQIPLELDALNQHQVDECLEWSMRHWGGDIIMMEYLYSAMFCPRVMRNPSIRKVMITQNREAEFYRNQIQLGLVEHDPITARFAAWRVAKFERASYRACEKVIALSVNDIPAFIPKEKVAVISPYPDENVPWSYTGSRNLFFVGNIRHYPNKEAIEFIATKLAPELSKMKIETRFKIIGATSGEVPDSWKHHLIDYLGPSDAETVDHMFLTCDATIAPIKNNFGSKYKVVEAISHGTPIIANIETLEGAPFIKSLPSFAFGDTATAANLVADLVGNAPKLKDMSEKIKLETRQFAKSQLNRWSQVLAS